jgi:lysophospholipase L1-like esterase
MDDSEARIEQMDTTSEPVTRKTRIFNRYPRTSGVLLAVVFLLIADLSLGAAFRVITGDSFYYSVIDKARGLNRKYRKRSPPYHHDLKKNVSMPASWGRGYQIHTNSLGFKDRETREVPLRADGPRAVFIGDSFTEGVGMNYEDTFVGILDTHFHPRGVEILNAGVSSYSPAIYYRKIRYLLEEVGLRFTHLVVFIDISDAEDEARQYTIDERDVVVGSNDDSFIKRFLKEYSILYGIPRAFKLGGTAEAADIAAEVEQLNLAIENPRGLWTIDETLYDQYGERGIDRMREHMDRLVELIRPYGIDLTIVVYPWPAQIFYKDLDSMQVRIWRTWSRENGAHFINLFPDFISSDDAVNARAIRALFIRDDFHWNDAGHRRVAELFLLHGGLASALRNEIHAETTRR